MKPVLEGLQSLIASLTPTHPQSTEKQESIQNAQELIASLIYFEPRTTGQVGCLWFSRVLRVLVKLLLHFEQEVDALKEKVVELQDKVNQLSEDQTTATPSLKMWKTEKGLESRGSMERGIIKK